MVSPRIAFHRLRDEGNCMASLGCHLLYVYSPGMDRKTYLGKMLKWLIGGSILELLVATPIHAMVWNRAKYVCDCTQGSYVGLVLGGVVLVWTFGPGVVLLFQQEKAATGTTA